MIDYTIDLSNTNLFYGDSVVGQCTGNDIRTIIAVINKYNLKRIFEIGTFRGLTCRNIARNTNCEIVTTLDLPPEKEQGELITYIGDLQIAKNRYSSWEEPKVTRVYGDSATWNGTEHYGKYDLCFIDGAHSLEYTTNDSYLALKLVPNGILIWHDLGMDAVRDAIAALKKGPIFSKIIPITCVDMVIMPTGNFIL